MPQKDFLNQQNRRSQNFLGVLYNQLSSGFATTFEYRFLGRNSWKSRYLSLELEFRREELAVLLAMRPIVRFI